MVIIKKDLNLVREVVKEELKEQFKDFREELDENLEAKFTQQRSDFFAKIDPLLKEVTASREERIINDHKLSDHEDRITALEATQ